MSKSIAYWALHYGKEYLAWSVRSVQAAVDELHFLYTPRPSFGHETTLICPDTEEELKAEAGRWATKPIFWHRNTYRNEGEHREAIHHIAAVQGATQALWVDADEIWADKAAAQALEAAAGREEGVTRVRFIHFWRSLGWFCEDPAMPTRVVNIGRDPKREWYLEGQVAPVFHMGYAQSPAITRYKQDIHGHKGEWKPRWFEDTFMRWRPDNSFEDVHPTCGRNQEGVAYWTPKQAKSGDLQYSWWKAFFSVMYDHPYMGKELIS